MIYIQVISSPPPLWNTGGTARQSDALIKLMAKNETVILVTQKTHASLAQKHFENYKNIFIFDTYIDFSKTKPISFLQIKKLDAFIKSLSSYDGEKVVIHCLESKSVLTFQMAVFCKSKKFELWLSPFGQGSAILNKKFSVFRHFYKFIVNSADRIICQNRDEFLLFKKNSELNNTFEIPLLIDPELNQRSALAHEKDSEKIKIGFLGRNTKLKGVVQIIDFVNEISNRVNVELFLALSGNDSDVNSAISNSKIDIDVSTIDNSFDRISFYERIDVFIILPTVQEETSLAALEAALLGCKIIYNSNCMFSNTSMFGDICCLIDNFNFDWLMTKIDTSDYDRIRNYYYNVIPDEYRKIAND